MSRISSDPGNPLNLQQSNWTFHALVKAESQNSEPQGAVEVILSQLRFRDVEIISRVSAHFAQVYRAGYGQNSDSMLASLIPPLHTLVPQTVSFY